MEQETKKTTLIVIWCIAAVVLLAGAVWLWINFSEFNTYHDNQYKLSVKYPSKWKKIEQYKGTVVAFIRPKKTALDVISPNVNITVQEVPAHIATLSSFSETITKQMTAVFGNNITILENKDTRFANRPGHRLVILAVNPDNVNVMFLFTIKGSMAYIFTFLARKDQYKELLPTINKMTDSFELK